MADDIPSPLLNEANKTVFGFIKDLSAHDNIASSLMEAVKPLGDVQIFCPDWAMYRYVIASTKNIVFGVAVGMDIIGFRLGPLFKS